MNATRARRACAPTCPADRLAAPAPRLVRRTERGLAHGPHINFRTPRRAPTNRRIGKHRFFADAGLEFERTAGSHTSLVHTASRAAALHLDTVPRPVGIAAVRHRAAGPESRPALRRIVTSALTASATQMNGGGIDDPALTRTADSSPAATIGQRFTSRLACRAAGEVAESRSTSNMVGEIECDRVAEVELTARDGMGPPGVQHPPRPGRVQYRRGPIASSISDTATAKVGSSNGRPSAGWRLSPSWQVFARQVYSTKEQKSTTASSASSTEAELARPVDARRLLSNRTGASDNSSCCNWNSRACLRSEPAMTLSCSGPFGDTPPAPQPPCPDNDPDKP